MRSLCCDATCKTSTRQDPSHITTSNSKTILSLYFYSSDCVCIPLHHSTNLNLVQWQTHTYCRRTAQEDSIPARRLQLPLSVLSLPAVYTKALSHSVAFWVLCMIACVFGRVCQRLPLDTCQHHIPLRRGGERVNSSRQTRRDKLTHISVTFIDIGSQTHTEKNYTVHTCQCWSESEFQAGIPSHQTL